MSESRFRPVKAYKNENFIASPDARPLRILAEYVEPQTRFHELRVRDTIVFFGSARFCSREKAEAELAAARASGGDVGRAEMRLRTSRYYEETRQLAFRLTQWSKSLTDSERRFVVCSGGGPGIMEAANRGASEAKGENIGLNISLPFEQSDNPYITRRLAFEFHYFFMRKFWFSYLAKAMVVMPGGFGTLDEFMEVVTLVQTLKIKKHLPIVLFGTDYWDKILHCGPMVEYGTISPEDLNLFYRTDSVDEAFRYLVHELETHVLRKPGNSSYMSDAP
ncbi:MAG: LOG family protein [Planctomycetes bacterium]|nr:LOG family protein [Planctomycetota bacterium]